MFFIREGHLRVENGVYSSLNHSLKLEMPILASLSFRELPCAEKYLFDKQSTHTIFKLMILNNSFVLVEDFRVSGDLKIWSKESKNVAIHPDIPFFSI